MKKQEKKQRARSPVRHHRVNKGCQKKTASRGLCVRQKEEKMKKKEATVRLEDIIDPHYAKMVIQAGFNPTVYTAMLAEEGEKFWRLIDGELCCTATAQELGRHTHGVPGEDSWCEEVLYYRKTTGGQHFLYSRGGGKSEHIVLLSPVEAREWAERHGLRVTQG